MVETNKTDDDIFSLFAMFARSMENLEILSEALYSKNSCKKVIEDKNTEISTLKQKISSSSNDSSEIASSSNDSSGNADVDQFQKDLDEIVVYNKKDFIDSNYVYLNGVVRKPGRFLFKKGMRLSDIMTMAGGAYPYAELNRIEVERIEFKNSKSDPSLPRARSYNLRQL